MKKKIHVSEILGRRRGNINSMEQVVMHNEKKKCGLHEIGYFAKKRKDFDVGKHCAVRGIGLSPRSS